MTSDPVLNRLGDGTILLRKSLTAVFFLRRPAADVLGPLAETFRAWLGFAPPEGKALCLVGASATDEKPLTTARLNRCLEQLDPKTLQKKPYAFVAVMGPTRFGPDWSFEAFAKARVDGRGTECHRLEILFPLEMGAPPRADAVVEFVDSVASALPFDSGFATPTLYFSSSTDVKDSVDLLPGLVFRHPGLDISTTGGTAFEIGGHCRGARWLTYLGEDLVSSLGGVESIVKGAPAGTNVARIGDKIRIRAGESAEIGDVNRLDNLPLLRALAKQLEPITLFGDGTILATLGARAKEWERRFLD